MTPPCFISRLIRIAPASFAVLLLNNCGNSVTPNGHELRQSSTPELSPDFLGDPGEPVNRAVWAVNSSLLVGVVDPLAQVYLTIVPRPARESLGNFSYHVMWPGRLINQAVQGRWQDAGDDTARFATNTTLGVGGLFDVASHWEMPRPQASFAGTFQSWGWKPNTYVMLPILGPSDDCNAVGTALDTAANPLVYLGDEYRALRLGLGFNRIAESTGGAVRLIRTESDPYSLTRLGWSYLGRTDAPDWSVHGPRDPSTLQSLKAGAIQTNDTNFFRRERTVSATLPTTGKKAVASLWMRKEAAPLVYLLPGIGTHRLGATSLSVAEALYDSGYSVVAISSVFHSEFMERASTSVLPAYPPTDTADLFVALEAIDAQLTKRHPGRFTKRAMVGISMGGYHALHLSAHESKRGESPLVIDRYVAINPPIDLLYGAGLIDQFHAAPLSWPEDERRQRINNTVHKVGGLDRMDLAEISDPPFSAVESKYLIGLTFRLILRDMLYNSQSRENLGVLKTPISRWNRRDVYREIFDITFEDYADRFVFPYYATRGISKSEIRRHGNLRNFTGALRQQSKAHVITNENDFLMVSGDMRWLRQTFGTSRLSAFPNGGHLGNLGSPEVQSALINHLSDLK